MTFYKITIVDENEFYNNSFDLASPCYVEANSENEALEKIYQYANESSNILGNLKIVDKNQFCVTSHTDDIRNFGDTHIHINNTDIWTKK